MPGALRSRQSQSDFSYGMVRDIAPELIPQNGAYDLGNCLLDEDGQPYLRGGTKNYSSGSFSGAGLTWNWDGYLLPGQRTVFADDSSFGVLDGGKAQVNLGGEGLPIPKQAAALDDMLFIGGGSIYGGSRKAAPYSTGTVKVEQGSKVVKGSGTTWNTLVDAGMLFHTGTERVYVIASIDSPTQITLRDAYQGSTGEEKSYSLNPIWTVGGSDPYEPWDFLCVCANRLVLLNGRTIKFTEVENPHTFTNSLGTTNEHTLPEGVEGRGLATMGEAVLVFTTGGIWVLEGLALAITDQNGNAQHRLQLLSSDVVLVNAAGLAGVSQQLLVPAMDGCYLMDGVSAPSLITWPIDRYYRELVLEGCIPGNGAIFHGHVLLPMLTSEGEIKTTLVCNLEHPLRIRRRWIFPWTRFFGDGGEIISYAVHVPVTGDPLLLGAQRRAPSQIVDCTHYFQPDSEHAMDADGSTHEVDLTTRDFETGSQTLNVVKAVKPRYSLVDPANDDPKIRVYYSDGSLKTGEAEWDESTWDEFDWADDGGASFTQVGEAGPSDGRNPVKFRLGKRLRYMRVRIKSSGPISLFVLRSLELDTRPSEAIRR
jgi:hypothetical protein